uniref:Variant surface glycoprotein 1125.2106 n=1 Tax=Trypanosoma brucei TaxID=5691 RepID=M4TDN6_9TRYP|nr:variant surface glycoprotein 623 [Trypanosoma brucei]APD73981.1 variant surface glycoprotein 1125.2106 [Trypanosoma brucei]
MLSDIKRLMWTIAILALPGRSERENVKQFSALCSALQAARAPVSTDLLNAPDNPEKIPTAITALYATAIPDGYFNNETYGLFKTKEEFEEIRETLKNTKTKEKQLVYKRIPETPSKREAERALERLYNKTMEQINVANNKHKELKQLAQEAQAELYTAVTGDATGKAADADNFAARPAGCTPSGTPSTDKQSLAQALACLCSATTNGATLCFNGVTSTTYGTGAANSGALTAYTAIVAKCKQNTQQPADPRTLQNAIATFSAALGNHAFTGNGKDGRYVLGNGAGNACTNGNSQSACVNYHGAIKSDNIQEITWVKNLITAADKLEQAALLRTEISALQADFKDSEALAWQIRHTADIVAAVPQATTAGQQQQMPESDCNKQQNNSSCKSPCKWNDKATDSNKKCSLDTAKAAEQANQAAGTGEGAADKKEEKCTGKDEKTCGTTQGCQWENNACKDSSILANKQLALIVSSFLTSLF